MTSQLTFHEQQMLEGGFQFPKSRKRRSNHHSAPKKPITSLSHHSRSNLFDIMHFRKKVAFYREQMKNEGNLLEKVFAEEIYAAFQRREGLERFEGRDLPQNSASTRTTMEKFDSLSVPSLPKTIFVYGIGDLQSQASLFQFACLLTILATPFCEQIQHIYMYDPILELSLDSDALGALKETLLKEYNVQCLNENDECCRMLSEPSIVYMPHCPRGLYINLLRENWGASLANLLLIGNTLPLPKSVIHQEWSLTGIFSQYMTRNDLSTYGLNDTNIYMLQNGNVGTEDWEEFSRQYLPDQESAQSYVTRETLQSYSQ